MSVGEMPMMATSAMASRTYSGGGGSDHMFGGEAKMLRRFDAGKQCCLCRHKLKTILIK
jgi:hypothetical protein